MIAFLLRIVRIVVFVKWTVLKLDQCHIFRFSFNNVYLCIVLPLSFHVVSFPGKQESPTENEHLKYYYHEQLIGSMNIFCTIRKGYLDSYEINPYDMNSVLAI